RDRDAEVGAGTFGGPGVGEFAAVGAVDVHGGKEFGALEPGAVDDDVDFVVDTVGGAHAGGGDLGDCIGFHGDVRPAEGGEIVVGEQRAFTAGGVVGGEFLAQDRVGDLPGAVGFGDLQDGGLDALQIGEGQCHHLEEHPPAEAFGPADRGQVLEYGVVAGRVCGVGLGEHPGGGTLEQGEVFGDRL